MSDTPAPPVVLCPVCQGRTSVVNNSFYGRGLSLSETIRLCARCDWVQLVKGDRPVHELVVPPVAGIVAFLRRCFSRTKRVEGANRVGRDCDQARPKAN